MNEEDLKKAKENLKNIEFNNSDEDEEIIEEENGTKKSDNNGNDKSKQIIVICCVIIAILLLIIVLFITGVLGGSKSENLEDKEPDSEDVTPIEDDDDTKNEILEVSSLESYFVADNYLLVTSDKNSYITNLDGEVVLKLDGQYEILKGSSNYFAKSDGKNYVIKKFDKDRVIDVIKLETENAAESAYILDEKGNIVGVYDKNGTKLYIIANNVSKEIDLGKSMIYTFSVAQGEPKKIYNSRYAIIINNSKYGIYDIKDDKMLIEPTYDGLEYLHDDKFVAVKNDKHGVIDASNKELTDYDYDFVTYSNGWYIVGYEEALHVLNSKFEVNGSEVKISNYSEFSYNPCCGRVNSFTLGAFKDKAIITYGDVSIIIDKDGKMTQYDFNKYVVYGNYLITTKGNSTVVTMYDSNMKKIADYNTQRKDSDLNSAAIYLNNNFIINGRQLFELSTGKFKYSVNSLSRSYQGYMIVINFTDKGANAVVSLEDKEIGRLENIDVTTFLKSDNNGIKLTKEYFILSLHNKNLIIKK